MLEHYTGRCFGTAWRREHSSAVSAVYRWFRSLFMNYCVWNHCNGHAEGVLPIIFCHASGSDTGSLQKKKSTCETALTPTRCAPGLTQRQTSSCCRWRRMLTLWIIWYCQQTTCHSPKWKHTNRWKPTTTLLVAEWAAWRRCGFSPSASSCRARQVWILKLFQSVPLEYSVVNTIPTCVNPSVHCSTARCTAHCYKCSTLPGIVHDAKYPSFCSFT